MPLKSDANVCCTKGHGPARGGLGGTMFEGLTSRQLSVKVKSVQ